MTEKNQQIAMPQAIDELPEPARSIAMQVFLERREEGARGMDAVHAAVDMAMQWIAERAPGDRAEVRSPDRALADREPMDTDPANRADVTARGIGS